MNRHERISRALRGYAEMRVPGAADPWPEIRESLVGSEAVAGPRSSRRFRLVPRTRAGLVFAVLLVMLFGTVGFAASEIAYELFQQELPGLAGEENAGVPINERQTAYGTGVTLERVYADAGYVVISFTVENLDDEQRTADYPANLLPVFNIEEPWYEKSGGSEPWPRGVPYVDLTDESGGSFQVIDASGYVYEPNGILGGREGPKAQSVAFATSETLQPGRIHRFRFEVPLQIGDPWPPKPIGEPVVFDFEVPVKPTPITELDLKSAANGLTLTLDRVVRSPGRPHAVLCFDPPDEGYVWEPLVQKTGHENRQMDNGCWAIDLHRHADSYSLTIPHITGYSKFTPRDKKVIHGPWTFEFEVPEQ
jgi:hypothetical protein